MDLEYEAIPKPLETLAPDQKLIRDDFVSKYTVSYSAIDAVMEMGYPREYADEIARKLMNCAYVARRVREVEDGQDGDLDIEKRRLFAALRREAAYYGAGSSHGARVAALTKLASLRGMDKPVKFEHDVTARGGVMQVPGIAAPGDWEASATQSQSDLTRDA